MGDLDAAESRRGSMVGAAVQDGAHSNENSNSADDSSVVRKKQSIGSFRSTKLTIPSIYSVSSTGAASTTGLWEKSVELESGAFEDGEEVSSVRGVKGLSVYTDVVSADELKASSESVKSSQKSVKRPSSIVSSHTVTAQVLSSPPRSSILPEAVSPVTVGRASPAASTTSKRSVGRQSFQSLSPSTEKRLSGSVYLSADEGTSFVSGRTDKSRKLYGRHWGFSDGEDSDEDGDNLDLEVLTRRTTFDDRRPLEPLDSFGDFDAGKGPGRGGVSVTLDRETSEALELAPAAGPTAVANESVVAPVEEKDVLYSDALEEVAAVVLSASRGNLPGVDSQTRMVEGAHVVGKTDVVAAVEGVEGVVGVAHEADARTPRATMILDKIDIKTISTGHADAETIQSSFGMPAVFAGHPRAITVRGSSEYVTIKKSVATASYEPYSPFVPATDSFPSAASDENLEPTNAIVAQRNGGLAAMDSVQFMTIRRPSGEMPRAGQKITKQQASASSSVAAQMMSMNNSLSQPTIQIPPIPPNSSATASVSGLPQSLATSSSTAAAFADGPSASTTTPLDHSKNFKIHRRSKSSPDLNAAMREVEMEELARQQLKEMGYFDGRKSMANAVGKSLLSSSPTPKSSWGFGWSKKQKGDKNGEVGAVSGGNTSKAGHHSRRPSIPLAFTTGSFLSSSASAAGSGTANVNMNTTGVFGVPVGRDSLMQGPTPTPPPMNAAASGARRRANSGSLFHNAVQHHEGGENGNGLPTSGAKETGGSISKVFGRAFGKK
jgi:hypothetical protein